MDESERSRRVGKSRESWKGVGQFTAYIAAL